jgi:hypothetical protein
MPFGAGLLTPPEDVTAGLNEGHCTLRAHHVRPRLGRPSVIACGSVGDRPQRAMATAI